MQKVTKKLVKSTIKEPDPNSHKGENGNILIIGGSPLFHGAGRLAAKAALEVSLSLATKTNDMVYFASTPENLDYLKIKYDSFIGIKREQIDSYLKNSETILSGTGLMREPDPGLKESEKEAEFTKDVTLKVIKSNKKVVLDAGSLQVIEPEILKENKRIIITPHRKEMSKLFNVKTEELLLTHSAEKKEIEKVAELVQKFARKYEITILLKGPIDIIANKNNWLYSTGGNVGMTKGGTGDVLAGLTAALYSQSDDALNIAAAASFINKKTGDLLWKDKKWFYNASELADKLRDTLVSIIS